MWKAFLSDDVIKLPTEFNRYRIRCALFDFVVVASSFCSSFLWSIYTYSSWSLLLHWVIVNRKIDPMPIKSISSVILKPLDGNVTNSNASTSSVFYWKRCGVRNKIAAILHIVISKHLFEGHLCTLRQTPMKFINEEPLSELMKTPLLWSKYASPNHRLILSTDFYTIFPCLVTSLCYKSFHNGMANVMANVML